MITPFGKLLRSIRVTHGEVLRDMAERLEVSPSFISAIEVGKKKVPQDFLQMVGELYQLSEDERTQLYNAARESAPSVKINLFGSDENQREAALIFARDFSSLSDKTAKEIINLLKGSQSN